MGSFGLGAVSLVFLCFHCWRNNCRKPKPETGSMTGILLEAIKTMHPPEELTPQECEARKQRSKDMLSGKTPVPDMETLKKYLKNTL